MTLTGVKFYTETSAVCQFATTPPLTVPAAVISETEVHCNVPPNALVLGDGVAQTVDVEASMDAGAGWTWNQKKFTFYQVGAGAGAHKSKSQKRIQTHFL